VVSSTDGHVPRTAGLHALEAELVTASGVRTLGHRWKFFSSPMFTASHARGNL
jgi:hypothetical protein